MKASELNLLCLSVASALFVVNMFEIAFAHDVVHALMRFAVSFAGLALGVYATYLRFRLKEGE